MSDALVSVIMPTFNKAEYLRLTLVGFTLQSYTTFELIIVDDGSSDHTKQVIESFKDVLTIRAIHQPNSGRSAARNVALDAARGQIWVFNDDDRIPTPNFLYAHVKCLEDNPDAISIGYKQEILTLFDPDMLLLWDQSLRDFVQRNPEFIDIQKSDSQTALVSVEELTADFERWMERLYYQIPIDQHLEVMTEYGVDLEQFAYGWLMCTTGNLAMVAADSMTVRFDEQFTGWGLEDSDFAFQWCLRGRVTVCTLAALNHHQVHRRGVNEYDELRANMTRFNKKYSTASEHRPVIPPDLLVVLTRYIMGDLSLLDLNAISLSLSRAPHDKLLQDYLYLARMRAKLGGYVDVEPF